MLPKELLEVRKSRGKILPKFAGDKDYALAERIIKIFKAGKGRKYGSILSALKSLENAENYRKVRGLARVMENFCADKACMFYVSSPLDPVEVRLYLFEKGYVTTKKERQRVIEYAARYFNTTPEEIERAMFADRDEELILVDVRQINADTLIRLYNLSLLQTALFNCLRMTFWTSSNHKEIFRRIKWLGLMYELYEEGDQILTDVTGPASILKMTRKYGTSMAKIVPSIVKADRWWIRAEILDDSGKIYILEIDDSYKHLFPERDEKVEYDSSLEEEFVRKLRAIKPDIEVVREPDVVKAGRYAFVPDFLIRKGEKEVYVEIAGFWTPEYVEKKIEKVKEAGIPLILIAREEFGEGKLKSEDVIMFSKKMPYSEIVKRINAYLRRDVKEIEFREDVVNLKELSNAYGVSVKEIAALIPEDYILAGSYAVKRKVFERMSVEVEHANPEKLSDVAHILEKYGVGCDILPDMGYRIKWIGLTEEDAIIEKVSKNCKTY
ncbi:DUF790 family protein [Archaeoglobus veneficus]|uniref:Uncharacterized protein n=1 Tax=Archaeoglobus veneficus (strain DSM 11195 / SNP6) TaxID=693661 RepID=F2KQ35_ARCVS|nr:DUF790 family protein [Archaeoglobus veneficus]AEA47638.1 protein of unknown function DUF790 [Archaeoglobus veneficus SNP6]